MMGRSFYARFAVSNIRKNAKTFVPYTIACIFTTAMYYIIRSLSQNEGIRQMRGAATISEMLSFGKWVAAIFAAIFLFYTNSFLMKQRKKEFGLYNILGMEKRHISRVIAFETFYIFSASVFFGLLFGILLDKLMYLIIARFFGQGVPLGFYISSKAVLSAVVLIGVVFILIFINSIRQIYLADPIELLKSKNAGEKEPKARWILAAAGIISLLTAYYISVTVLNPVAALTKFFVAVILVIVGTYLLFVTGSIAVLKSLKKSKRYYYKPKHFISVSGMIYRMKQNAVGLANICILSTMVLVMVSSTLSLVLGFEDIMTVRYPHDISVTPYSSEEMSKAGQKRIENIITSAVSSNGCNITKEVRYTFLKFAAARQGSSFLVEEAALSWDSDNLASLWFIPLEDYNRITGNSAVLNDNQIMVSSDKNKYKDKKLNIFGMSFDVADVISDFYIKQDVVSTYYIIVKDINVLNDIYEKQKEIYGSAASEISQNYEIDTDGGHDENIAVYKSILDSFAEFKVSAGAECRDEARDDLFSTNAGFFFLGIFLGTLFTMAAILIIYYKQISEGFDDRDRFIIMQNVGLSRAEIKRSIRSQILTVFFLPLITAGVHVAFAFPVIKKLLILFGLTNTGLFIAVTIGTFLAFSLLYAIIYGITARSYYHIVTK